MPKDTTIYNIHNIGACLLYLPFTMMANGNSDCIHFFAGGAM